MEDLNQNPTLEESAEFTFKLLGSFCDNNGFTKAAQNALKKELPLDFTNFARYNLTDGKSEISKLCKKFENKIAEFYGNQTPVEIFYLLKFPFFLQQLTAEFIRVYAFGKNSMMQIVVSYYFAYIAYQKGIFPPDNHSVAETKKFIAETYTTIQKDYPCFKFAVLNESAVWQTVCTHLEDVKKSDEKNKQKNEYAARILRHYLLVNFKKALEIFLTEERIKNTFEYIKENLEILTAKVEFHYKFKVLPFFKSRNIPYINSPVEMFTYDLPIQDFKNQDLWYRYNPKIQNYNGDFLNNLIVDSGNYFLNGSDTLSAFKADLYLNQLKEFSDVPIAVFFEKWFKARKMIFNLNFDENAQFSDAEILKIQNLFKEAFENGKYCAGQNLREFLSDAIIADVYFNQKDKKNIIKNTQDFKENSESSIKKPGKTYWEFGYALGIFPEDSSKTYLASFNAEKNFWQNFPARRFVNYEKAMRKCLDELAENEFKLLELARDFGKSKKSENLLSLNRKSFLIELGSRQYSNLTIAILNLEEKQNYEEVHNYIENADEKILVKNDECGATPLIRALNEYKNLVYGFDYEARVQRDKILFDTTNQFYEKFYSKKEFQNFEIVSEFFLKPQESIIKNFSELYYAYVNYYNKNHQGAVLLEKAKRIKNEIIIPLIKKIGESKSKEIQESLLDEAIILNNRHCVSALQLAIDSYDFELVELLAKCIESSGKNLSDIFISDEFLGPISYAVRKYDYFMQSSSFTQTKEHEISLLKKRKYSNKREVSGGILPEDLDFLDNREKMLLKVLDILPTEECGLLYKTRDKSEHNNELEKNLPFVNQKNLYRIITEFFAKKINPIPIDTFYYIADMTEEGINEQVYTDILAMACALIDSGNADFNQTNFSYWNHNELPQETFVSKCLRDRKYALLRTLLNKYPQKFTKILNSRVIGTGKTQDDVRCETDVHMFVLNMIESTKKFESMTDENEKKNYGNQIALTIEIMLDAFKNAGANFNIKNQAGKTVNDLLEEWKDRFPKLTKN